MILGIHDGTHDAGAALVLDGRLFAACSEERFTRHKGQGGWPSASIAACLQRVGARPKDVEKVVFPGVVNPNPGLRLFRKLQSDFKLDEGAFYSPSPSPGDRLGDWLQFRSPFPRLLGDGRVGRALRLPLQVALGAQARREGLVAPVRVEEHHRCHAASAYWTCPWDEALVLIADGVGDGLALSAWVGRPSGLRRVGTMPYPDSYGLLFATLTGFLGFRPFRHEGKLVGLAATGDRARIRTPFPFAGPPGQRRFTQQLGQGLRPFLAELRRELDAGATRADLCAWLQHNVEEDLTALARHYVERTGLRRFALAGGVFANVRLNQRIAALGPIFVHPHMGDGGLAAGAALTVAPRREALAHAFLGPEASSTLGDADGDVARTMAEALAADQLVGRWEGAMEYGPRSLGHRSILAPAHDRAVTQRLNTALDRSDFMPFAPLLLAEDAERWVDGLANTREAARFMTVTVQAKPELERLCPAVVHVDGSLRPQLVDSTTPALERTLRLYRERTGLPAVINTSFNLHEEPIVCSDGDALRTGRAARLDVLTFGDRSLRP